MNNKINWDVIPSFTIDCRKLTHPSEICAVFTKLNVDKYVYKIMFKGIVIKFGMSADKSRNYGDRVYRQIGHSACWSQGMRLRGNSGADWRIIEEEFLRLYGFPIDLKFVTVKVWDLTKYPFRSINSRNEVLAIEAELINNYVIAVGEKPIGNLNDEAWYLEKCYINKDTMATLFENYEELVK